MIIKDSQKDHILVAKSKHLLLRVFQNKVVLTWTIACLVVLYSTAVALFSIKADRSGVVSDILMPAIRNNYRIPLNYMQGMLTNPERIIIDIKFKEYQRLEYQRDQAFKRGLLVLDENDYVKASIRHNGKSYKIRLRLKGDTIEHLQGDKWSFRVKMRGESTLWGMKQFSLHDPKHRNFLYEWVYHKALKKTGVIGLRYKFVEVILNGKTLGIYAVEEHFEKRLIEHNKIREGPIIRFTEDIYWDTYHWQDFRQRFDTEAYLASDIDAFQTTSMQQNPAQYHLFTRAISLLESFRRGVLKTSDVFDVDKLAMFIAVSDLMGGRHCNRWHNKKFYYNPVTSKLEPIGFDSMPGARISSLTCEYNDWFEGVLLNKLHWETIFNDPLVFEKYVQALEHISEPSFLDTLFAEVDEELSHNLNILYREFPYYDRLFSRDVLYQNQDFIRRALNPSKGMNVYARQVSPDGVVLELGNLLPFPLRVSGVTYQDTPLPLANPVLVPAKEPAKTVTYNTIRLPAPANQPLPQKYAEGIKVFYTILGSHQEQHETVYPWPHMEIDFLKNDFMRRSPNAHTVPWLKIDEKQKKIIIAPGSRVVAHSIIIPEGYEVVNQGNLQLNLRDSALLLSYSPITLIGSAEDPIVIQSSGNGQGIVIMNADKPSFLQHVVFEGLSAPAQNGWELTGAVTFYESPVNLSHVQFRGCRSEDTLNLIRSKFSLDSCLFEQSASDSLDADFCEGTLYDSSFVECGNDCVDVSGSTIDIKNLFINGAGDKGLSAGERSTMRINTINIRGAEIAIASKDLSTVTGKNLNIDDGSIGLTVYQKKPEFGPAQIIVDKAALQRMSKPYLVENGSTAIVNGKTIAPSRSNVKAILYGAEYGKSSR